MIDSILVSVIIPVYNTELFVEEAINSVLNQTHKNLDIIVINDGSKDHSADVCKKFHDERIRFIDRDNRGLSATRQEGIDLAKGDYFCTLDADDTFDTTFVEKMLSQIVEDKSDVCVCERYDFNEDSKKLIRLNNSKTSYNVTKADIEESFEIFFDALALSDSWNKLYNTEFVKQSGIRFTLNNKYNGTDLLFNHLLLLHCPKYSVLNEPLMNHRYVLGSRVHRKNRPFQEGFNIIMGCIISESAKLCYPESINIRLGKMYYGFCDRSLRRILSESESIKELSNRLDTYFLQIDSFLEKFADLSLIPTETSHHYLLSKLLKAAIYYRSKVASIILYLVFNRI